MQRITNFSSISPVIMGIPIHKLKKFRVLFKAWQGKKTFDMFKLIDDCKDDNNLHIIFTDNYIIQGKQLVSRIHEYKTIQNIPISLNCKAERPNGKTNGKSNMQECGAKHYLDVKNIIEATNRNIVIAPTNTTKTLSLSENLNSLIRARNESDFPNFDGVYIWIDEIDKNVKFFKNEINQINSMEVVKNIYGLTATGLETLFYVFEEDVINLVKPSELLEEYEGFKNHDINIIENDEDSQYDDYDCQYFDTILKHTSGTIIQPGSKVFAPSLPYIENHENLKNLALQLGFDYVVVINGKNKAAFSQNCDDCWIEDSESVIPIPLDEKNKSLDAALASMAASLDWDNKAVLITGHFCVTRGITIQYRPREESPGLPQFLFTHAIVPLCKKIKKTTSEKSKIDQYRLWNDFSQLAARANGSYGDIRTKPLKFYTNEHGKSVLLGLENINNTIGYNKETITKYEFHQMLDENIQISSKQGNNKICIHDTAFKSKEEVNMFLKEKKLGAIRSCFHEIDGYVITSRLISRKIMKPGNRLLKSEYVNKPKGLNISGETKKGQKYMVYPVYETIDSLPEDVLYYIHYLKD